MVRFSIGSQKHVSVPQLLDVQTFLLFFSPLFNLNLCPCLPLDWSPLTASSVSDQSEVSAVADRVLLVNRTPQPPLVVALNDKPVNHQSHFACCSFTLPASWYWSCGASGSVITLHSFEAALDCSCQPAAYHWGFARFYQPKHCFSPGRTGVPVICIHISIWAVPLLLLLLTHQHGAGFSFAETGRFGLINVITRMWFCIHAHRGTLIVTYSPCDSLTVRD